MILESVGGPSLAAAILLVAPNGTIVVFGNSSNEDTTISFMSFAGHSGAQIQSFFSYMAAPPQQTDPDLAQLVSLIAMGKLTPEIGMQRSWRELGQGVEALRNRQVSGKVVFTVD